MTKRRRCQQHDFPFQGYTQENSKITIPEKKCLHGSSRSLTSLAQPEWRSPWRPAEMAYSSLMVLCAHARASGFSVSARRCRLLLLTDETHPVPSVTTGSSASYLPNTDRRDEWPQISCQHAFYSAPASFRFVRSSSRAHSLGDPVILGAHPCPRLGNGASKQKKSVAEGLQLCRSWAAPDP